MPLSDVKARNAKPKDKPYQLTDGDGLYLDVRPSGAKVWRVRMWLNNKEIRYTIGDYPHITLVEARQAKDSAKQQAKSGTNPNQAKQQAKIAQQVQDSNTLQSIALEWIEKGRGKRGAQYTYSIERVLKSDVYPSIGDMPIKSVTPAHVLHILQTVEKRGAECVAINIKMWLSAIFRYAVATLRADTDPAAPLRGVIERPQIQHARALSEPELAELLRRMAKYKGARTIVISINLVLLCMSRTVEVRKARWEEFDLDAALWRIPAERMKMKRPHIIPLSRQAVELLRELHYITGNGVLLFPSTRKPLEPVHATTHNMAIRYMGYSWSELSMHDLRATGSTILHEAGYRSEIIEKQLAHQEKNQSKRPYNHADYMNDRREMLQWWADRLDALRTI